MTDISKDQVYYLAGPMTGRPQFNIPMFEAVAEMLRVEGYQVLCPTELDDEQIRIDCLNSRDGSPDSVGTGMTWGDYLSRDIKIVADGADGVICLPGWEGSRGARMEVYTAVCTGKPVYEYDAYLHICTTLSLDAMGYVLIKHLDQHYAKGE